MWKSCKSYVLLSITTQVLSMLTSTLTAVWFIPTIVTMIGHPSERKFILGFIVVYALCIIAVEVFTTWYYQYRNPKELIVLHKNMRSIFYQKNLALDIKYYENSEYYNEYIRASDEIDVRAENVVNTVASLFSNIITIATITTLLADISYVVLIAVLVSATVTLLLNHNTNKIQYEMTKAVTPIQKKFNYINRVFYDIDFAKEVRISSMGHHLINLFALASEKMVNTQLGFRRRICKIGIISSILNSLFYYGILCYCVMKYYIAAIPLGQIVTFLNGITSLRSRILSLFSVFIELKKNSLYIENLIQYLNLKPSSKGKICNNKPLPKHNVDIAFQNVSFSYDSASELALSNINIEIKSKQHIAIVGRNGAGKSTLVKLLLRLYEPDKGSILLNDISISDYDLHEYYNLCTPVFQDYKIYSLTIAENVLMRECSCKEDEKIVKEALQRVGLLGKVSSYSQGIYTYVSQEYDEHGCFLSGGELQKLALARAFACCKNNKVVILDEPTSALDPISEKDLTDKMFEMFVDKTVIIISHKLSMVQSADIILYVEEGEIVERGTHNDLILLDGRYAKMYKAQAEKYRFSAE